MRDVIRCIRKYMEVIDDENFIIHWKRLSEKLLKGIQEGYKDHLHEPDIVKIIEYIINNIGQLSTKDKRFNISTSSIFIHGNRSQVEFEYYRKRTQRELGDIIFILSVIYNGKKYFEKMTINQIKKSKNVSWNFNNDSAKEQLYLLSRFPIFRGAKGSLIPVKDYNLPNNSDCLGTHGLLYYPGDFALISSKQLEVILSRKNNLKLKDLVMRIAPNNICPCFLYCYLLNDMDFEECLYILHDLIHFHLRYFRHFPPFICNLPILSNSCMSYNVYDFSNKYLMGYIGELIYAKKLPYNKAAFQFLHDLLSVIRKKAEREELEDVLKFISSYNYGYGGGKEVERYEESNYEGGGIGIIHTIINLGEGE